MTNHGAAQSRSFCLARILEVQFQDRPQWLRQGPASHPSTSARVRLAGRRRFCAYMGRLRLFSMRVVIGLRVLSELATHDAPDAGTMARR